MCKYANVLMCKYANVLMCKYANVLCVLLMRIKKGTQATKPVCHSLCVSRLTTNVTF